MKVLYTRVSTTNQHLDRQLENEKEFDVVIKEKGVSGSIPFWERPNTKKLRELLKEGKVSQIHTHSIDRLGRNMDLIDGDFFPSQSSDRFQSSVSTYDLMMLIYGQWLK